MRLPALSLLAVMLASSLLARAESDATGYWTTVDDDGKTPTAVVSLYRRGSQLHGKIVELINPPTPDPRCTKCSGSRKNQRVVGMEILWGLSRDGDEWNGGRILDPKNGREYACYVQLVDGGRRLKVRGYWGWALLGRTQYWRRGRPR